MARYREAESRTLLIQRIGQRDPLLSPQRVIERRQHVAGLRDVQGLGRASETAD